MATPPRLRCAIYTRKSSEEGLEQDFNSLEAQREACEAYIRSQIELGWVLVKDRYDDGGYSGGNIERPALTRLMEDVRARRFDIIVIYKIDRLTRSLTDFARLAEQFDTHGVSFVSVTQQFNTTTSMGRLMLNVLLSFAQFEREITGERIRDKIAASKQKGMWMGGTAPLGYTAAERTLVINEAEAKTVRTIYRLYLELGCVRKVRAEVVSLGLRTRLRPAVIGRRRGGIPMGDGHIYLILKNPVYAGRIRHKDQTYPGLHPPIIDPETWQRVQDQIAANRQGKRYRVTAQEPSLLAGLLFDGDGKRYVPSHAVKGGRRYRYYIHETLDRTGVSTRGKRLPAQEIEAAVQRAIRDLLGDAPRLLEVFGTTLSARNSSQIIAAAASRLQELPGLTPSAWCATLATLIERVQIHDDCLQISLRPHVLGTSLGCPGRGLPHETVLITVAIQIRMRGIQLRVIVPGERRATDPRIDVVLIRLIVRALAWRQQIETGAANSLRELAAAESISEAFVGRVLRLAYLAPRTIETITDGQQPVGLTAQYLLYRPDLPLLWANQSEYLAATL
ncbi:MAG: recombinase family protein [Gammaproteobacteria bacterium]